MRQPTLRPPLLAAGLTTSVLFLGVLCLAQDNTPAKKDQTAKQAFKNIQVLTDLPAAQLLPTMHQWSTSLGVRCDFCHVVGTDAAGRPHPDFASDAKPAKRTARQMLLMARDINAHQKIVAGRVTCYTCHHGQAVPESLPPRPENGPMSAPPAGAKDNTPAR